MCITQEQIRRHDRDTFGDTCSKKYRACATSQPRQRGVSSEDACHKAMSAQIFWPHLWTNVCRYAPRDSTSADTCY
jgi:hypothetical protein